VKPLTLRTRLTLVYTGILALLVTALSVTYYRALAVQLDDDATADLNELTTGLHGYLHLRDGRPVIEFDRTDPDQASFVERASRYYQIYEAESGQLIAESGALQPLGLHYTPEEVRRFRERLRIVDVETDRGRLRLSNSLVTLGRSSPPYLLQVGVNMNGVDAALEHFLRVLLWTLPASLAVVLLAGRLMAGRSLAPLADLASRTRAISVRDLRTRLPLRGAGDELDAVAAAFNDTLGRLEQAVGEMKQFSAAIAHELRTPLAALRGETELALLRDTTPAEYHRTLEAQLEEFDKLTRLVNQLLTLARAEAGEIPLAAQPVDLEPLVLSVVDDLEPVALSRDITLACDRHGPAVIAGDAGWLERLVLNLLDNAIKFTRPGGRITVAVWTADREAHVSITDTGIGMSAETLPRIFERFYRADPARSSSEAGTGLGLSLVKWITDHHGGRIEVRSEPDAGTTFVVTFPRVPAYNEA
jgi:heavy metal sensor kinase